MATMIMRVGVALLVLVAVVAVLGLVGRHLPPSAEQAEAMAAMEARAPATGTNAWGVIRLLPYAVPADQREAVIAEDVARLAAWVPDPPQEIEARGDVRVLARPESPPSPAQGRFERYEVATLHLPTCREPGDCLDRIRAEQDPLRDQLDGIEPLLARIDELATADHLRWPFEWRLDHVFVLSDGRQLHRPALVARGLQFLVEPLPAIAGVCRMHAASRRLSTGSDSLVDAMTHVGHAQASTQLLAEMLVELPPAQALPSDCEEALAPPGPQAAVICDAMIGEFHLSRRLTAQAMADSPGSALVHSDALAERWLAESMGWGCTAAGRERLAEDRPVTLDELPEPSSRWLQCFSAPVTCTLLGVAAPAYLDYHNRALDLAAEQRMLATAAALRPRIAQGEPVDPVLEELAQRWPGRPIRLLDDGRGLEMDRYGRGAGTVLRVPVAAPAQSGD